MSEDLKQVVFKEYEDTYTQSIYLEKAENGLWDSEKYFINKYFVKKGKLLDVGCGTGRTTIPLYSLGYEVIGLDLIPGMIKIAKEIASKKSLDIDYRVDDATNLSFDTNSFDYVIFSNNGWSQIPDSKQRQRALQEVCRVLKQGGIFIFTAHRRHFLKRKKFWFKSWLRHYVLKPFGFNIKEKQFGDILFERTVHQDGKDTKIIQFTHHSSLDEMIREIKKAGFNLIETKSDSTITQDKIKPGQKMFYICQK